MISPACSGTVTRPPRVACLSGAWGTFLANDHPALAGESSDRFSARYARKQRHPADKQAIPLVTVRGWQNLGHACNCLSTGVGPNRA
jgi:hypothetical protein